MPVYTITPSGGESISKSVITSGLILKLDSGNSSSYSSSGTNWYDISGNSNNATLVNGPTYSPDHYGKIFFDSIDDYASVPIISGISNAFTVGDE